MLSFQDRLKRVYDATEVKEDWPQGIFIAYQYALTHRETPVGCSALEEAEKGIIAVHRTHYPEIPNDVTTLEQFEEWFAFTRRSL